MRRPKASSEAKKETAPRRRTSTRTCRHFASAFCPSPPLVNQVVIVDELDNESVGFSEDDDPAYSHGHKSGLPTKRQAIVFPYKGDDDEDDARTLSQGERGSPAAHHISLHGGFGAAVPESRSPDSLLACTSGMGGVWGATRLDGNDSDTSCSSAKSMVSGPSTPAGICPSCEKLFDKMRRQNQGKHNGKTKDPASLAYDQWVLLKTWRPSRVRHIKGTLQQCKKYTGNLSITAQAKQKHPPRHQRPLRSWPLIGGGKGQKKRKWQHLGLDGERRHTAQGCLVLAESPSESVGSWGEMISNTGSRGHVRRIPDPQGSTSSCPESRWQVSENGVAAHRMKPVRRKSRHKSGVVEIESAPANQSDWFDFPSRPWGGSVLFSSLTPDEEPRLARKCRPSLRTYESCKPRNGDFRSMLASLEKNKSILFKEDEQP
ncbi:uncharacterized protein LOC114791210 isoform X2 [Denticeps clupeoides]|uniref:uncharacterized protein LOC114791210 isoform X2 n=1 Tax=Denticeps clupeoides TaxID=299321 RepID=UPI0010A2BE2E|nr:uncharacterized protein LOC114791210 isoform X2 [Denticeps clupeoides]